MNGLDAMRFLGVDPTEARDDLEELLMVALHNQVAREDERLAASAL